MDKIIELILTNITTFIITGACGWIVRIFKQMQEDRKLEERERQEREKRREEQLKRLEDDIKRLSKATNILLEDMMIRKIEFHKEMGYMPSDSKKRVYEIHSIYKDNGGNGTMNDYINLVHSMPMDNG